MIRLAPFIAVCAVALAGCQSLVGGNPRGDEGGPGCARGTCGDPTVGGDSSACAGDCADASGDERVGADGPSGDGVTGGDTAAGDATGAGDGTTPGDATMSGDSTPPGDAAGGDDCPTCTRCGPCDSGEVCVGERCAPVAIIVASEGGAQTTFPCPPGYTLAGRWQPDPRVDDGAPEGVDYQRFMIDAGWVWLCSADPANVYVATTSDDCGPGISNCATTVRGSWHVGGSCDGDTASFDALSRPLKSGWLGLCVEPGVNAAVELSGNDCGTNGPGCGGLRSTGSWHVVAAGCSTGATVAFGAAGQSTESGWVRLCVDTDDYVPVSTDTLTGKVVTGYQGWFAAPNDGSVRDHWVHWFRNDTPDAGNATVDLWPDLAEYSEAELFATSMAYGDGSPVKLFSSYPAATVDRHVRWMAEYGIDGAFLQRFLSEATTSVGLEFRDHVTQNVMTAAERYGRIFIIMYDISGATESTLVEDLIADWKHLVDDLGVTASDRYLHHRGLPLVAVWGFGFTDRPGSVAQAEEVLDFFANATEMRYRATVMGGTPTHWRTETGDSSPGFKNSVYYGYDVVSPWSVGRYADATGVVKFNDEQIQPDLADLTPKGIDYLPVVWPGFSWANLMQNSSVFNQIPRNGGRFFWRQVHEARASGATALYVAMFDEVDEATAIFKAAASTAQVPSTGTWLTLDVDGESVPSDWYLRLAGAAGAVLRGQTPNVTTLPPR